MKRSVVAEEEQSRIDKENAEREKVRAAEEAAIDRRFNRKIEKVKKIDIDNKFRFRYPDQ